MTKKLDPDFKALKAACRALNQSSSHRMLVANIEYLYDRYIKRPSKELPKHLQRWNP